VVIGESVEFLTSLKNFVELYGITNDRIKCIDKTYLQTSPWHKYIRHISPCGPVKSRRVSSDRGCVHEIWSALCADGRKGPFYVGTSSIELSNMKIFDADEGYVSYVPVLQDSKMKNIAAGERATLSYLYYMIHIFKFLNAGDILIFDGEPSLATPIVQQYLIVNHIFYFILPSYHHQLLSPNDNNFHSLFKMRYYRLLTDSDTGRTDVKQKLHLALQSYNDVSDDTVRLMFQRCGLTENGEDKRTTVLRLMSEGITSLDRHNQIHKICLLEFFKWCRANSLANELCPFFFNIF